MLVQKNSGQNIFSLQCFWFKKIKGQRNFSSKQFSGSRNVGQKILDFNFVWSNKSMGKTVGSKKIMTPKNCLVKIWPVTAEIFLLWTNFARTNVAWPNVTLTVGIC